MKHVCFVCLVLFLCYQVSLNPQTLRPFLLTTDSGSSCVHLFMVKLCSQRWRRYAFGGWTVATEAGAAKCEDSEDVASDATDLNRDCSHTHYERAAENCNVLLELFASLLLRRLLLLYLLDSYQRRVTSGDHSERRRVETDVLTYVELLIRQLTS